MAVRVFLVFMAEPPWGSCLLLSPAANNVEIDRDDDDRPGHHRLPFLGHGEDAQAIGENADDERADHGSEDRALAAAERAAADHRRCDRVELVAQAERWLGRVEAGGDD